MQPSLVYSDRLQFGFWAVAILALAASTVFMIYQWWLGSDARLALLVTEGGILETVHLVLLLAAAALFLDAWRLSYGPVGVAGGALGAVALAGFVRELEVKSLDAPQWFHYLAKNGLQEILLVGMTLPILVYLYQQRIYFWHLVELAKPRREATWPLYVAGVLLAVSIYLDERVVDGIRGRFWEELLETYGYLFLVISAYRHLRLVGDQILDERIT